MTPVRIDGFPLKVVHRLGVLDRWVAARTWPAPWAASGADAVNVVERVLAAMLLNPATKPTVSPAVQVLPVEDPTALVGSGPDQDVLRAGSALEVVLGTEVGLSRNRLAISWPGLVGAVGGPGGKRIPLPSTVSGLALRLGPTYLIPARGRGSISLRWQARAGRPVLLCAIEFDAAAGAELITPVKTDWKRVGLTVQFTPSVVNERLLWTHTLRIHLEPGGSLEQDIADRVRPLIENALDEWAPVLLGALTALPLRPVPDGPAFDALATRPMAEIGTALTNNLYATSTEPGLAESLVAAALLPSNPCRAVSVTVEGGLEIQQFPARLADHYVAHLRSPRASGLPSDPEVTFDVVALPKDSGTQIDMATATYGHWAPTPAAAQSLASLGECVVLREQYRVTLDHLVIPERSMGRIPLGVTPWTVEWRARVRHRRLAGNRWTTIGRWTAAPTVDGRLVTLGPAGVRAVWPEVRGDLAVVGVLRAGGTLICWFDVGARLLDHGPSGIGQGPTDAVGVLRATAGAQGPGDLEDADRADALVRAEQQTSLLGSMLDWLGLAVAHVALPRPVDAVAPVGPLAPLFVELAVGSQPVARQRLTESQCADLRGGKRVDVGSPSIDLYQRPTLIDPRLEVTVAVLGSTGDTDVTLASTTVTLIRDDPARPLLRWGVHPGAGVVSVFARDPGSLLHVRLDVANHHHDPSVVPVEDRVREIDLYLHEIEVVQPTEPTAANLAGLHFSATVSCRLDDVDTQEVGPIEVGPFVTDTAAATPGAPVLIGRAALGAAGADPFRLFVPEGTQVTVRLCGSEKAWWLPDQPLGTSTGTWSVTASSPIDAVAPTKSAKSTWSPSALSSPGGYFRFRLSAVGPAPPPPRFDPVGAPGGDEDITLELVAGDPLSFTYACVNWAASLVLQRRTDHGGDDVPWTDIGVPVLAIGQAGTSTVTLAALGRWRYRLFAANASGGQPSRTVVVSVLGAP